MADKTKKKPEPKRTIPLRSAGEKVTSVQEDRPSARLFAEVKRLEAETLPLPTTTHHPLPPPTTNEKEKILPVSPQRDFTKFANSIVRDAIPSGLFKGTSKNTYDVLYQRTRGAIEPKRRIKAVQSEIQRWANVSHNTLRTHLRHLEIIGLIKTHYRLGDNSGAEYEVFLPEEITPPYHPLPPTTTSQEMGSPIHQNLVIGGGRILLENIEEKATPNTLLKTDTKNDDEPFGTMIEILGQTGKGKREDWGELGQLLKMEFDIAASRTKGVTNAPKFLAEHLRRRLMPVKRETQKTKPTKSAKIGSQHPSEPVETYQPEPLTKEGRESTKKTFAGYIEKGQKDFLLSLEDTYTKEDWEWIKSELNL